MTECGVVEGGPWCDRSTAWEVVAKESFMEEPFSNCFFLQLKAVPKPTVLPFSGGWGDFPNCRLKGALITPEGGSIAKSSEPGRVPSLGLGCK